MAKRPTPIEREIAGESPDRRKRYYDRMRAKGFKRVAVFVPPKDVPLVSRIAELSRTLPRQEWDAFYADLMATMTAPAEQRGGTERPQRSEDAPRPRASRKARAR